MFTLPNVCQDASRDSQSLGWPDLNRRPLDCQVRSGGVVALGESGESLVPRIALRYSVPRTVSRCFSPSRGLFADSPSRRDFAHLRIGHFAAGTTRVWQAFPDSVEAIALCPDIVRVRAVNPHPTGRMRRPHTADRGKRVLTGGTLSTSRAVSRCFSASRARGAHGHRFRLTPTVDPSAARRGPHASLLGSSTPPTRPERRATIRPDADPPQAVPIPNPGTPLAAGMMTAMCGSLDATRAHANTRLRGGGFRRLPLPRTRRPRPASRASGFPCLACARRIIPPGRCQMCLLTGG